MVERSLCVQSSERRFASEYRQATNYNDLFRAFLSDIAWSFLTESIGVRAELREFLVSRALQVLQSERGLDSMRFCNCQTFDKTMTVKREQDWIEGVKRVDLVKNGCRDVNRIVAFEIQAERTLVRGGRTG